MKTHLRVPDKDELRAWAALVEAVDCLRDSIGTLPGRVTVLDTAAAGLAAAGRVGDSFRGSARVRALDQVDDHAGRAISRGNGGLTGTKDVDLRALALGEDSGIGGLGIDGGAADEERVRPQEEVSNLGRGPHVD